MTRTFTLGVMLFVSSCTPIRSVEQTTRGTKKDSKGTCDIFFVYLFQIVV